MAAAESVGKDHADSVPVVADEVEKSGGRAVEKTKSCKLYLRERWRDGGKNVKLQCGEARGLARQGWVKLEKVRVEGACAASSWFTFVHTCVSLAIL